MSISTMLMAHINRLSIAKRILLASAIFIIPIAMLSFFLVREKQELIDFARQEQLGTAYLRSSHALLIDLMSGQAEQAGRDAATLSQAARPLAKPLGLPATHETTVTAAGAARSRSEFAISAGAIADLEVSIADSSNLSLDPDMDSYYLMDVVVNQVPQIALRAGELRALVEARDKAGEELLAKRTIALYAFDAASTGLSASFGKALGGNASGTLETQLGSLHQTLSDAASRLQEAAKSNGDVVSAANQVAEAARTFLAAGDNELDRLLEARIGGFQGDLAIRLSISALLVLLGGVIAFFVGRSIVRPVASLTDSMRRLAEDDISVDVPGADRKDEIGRMARAVQVFKENAIEKQRLEQVQAATQMTTQHRQDEIERLIGFFGRSVSGVLKSLTGTSSHMSGTSSSLEHSADTTGQQAKRVLAEVEETGSTIQTVAAASQELAASIGEIGRQAGDSASGSRLALQQADDMVAKVGELRQAAAQIGSVVALINNIASQTNLLALNATIEAARAGEAGRGFSVVAGEVKALAGQTAQATQEISSQIAAIQAATDGAVQAMQAISTTVRGVNEAAVAIAAAVEEQAAATADIAKSIDHVTMSTASVAESMERVQDAASETSGNAAEVKRTAATLSVDADMLSSEVQQFLASLQDLGDDRGLRSLDAKLPASAVVDGQRFAGRVVKLSPATAVFEGTLPANPGALVELHIDSLDRPLQGRFVDRIPTGSQIQLLLNDAHLSYMDRILTRLGAAA